MPSSFHNISRLKSQRSLAQSHVRTLSHAILPTQIHEEPEVIGTILDLLRLFHEAKLIDIRVATDVIILTGYALAMQLTRLHDTMALVQAAGVVSAMEVTSWLGALEQADRAGRFFLALTCFFVSGRKP